MNIQRKDTKKRYKEKKEYNKNNVCQFFTNRLKYIDYNIKNWSTICSVYPHFFGKPQKTGIFFEWIIKDEHHIHKNGVEKTEIWRTMYIGNIVKN